MNTQMQEHDFETMPALNPTRSPDGRRSSTLVEVDGHVFQAVFVCLPTGELADPTIHGTRADRMTPAERIEREALARQRALKLKEEHEAELLAGMSVVTVHDLLSCVARAPKPAPGAAPHREADWDVVTGADEFPDPPRSHPVLSVAEWAGVPAWRFWGTLDVRVETDAEGRPKVGAEELAAQLGAKHVHIRGTWLNRPEVLAFF